MIAEVVPLTKLPRRFNFFDYTVPKNITIKVGDVIATTFRNQKIYGVVIKLKNKSLITKLKPVNEVLFNLFSKEDIKRLYKISNSIAQPISNVLNVTLNGIKKEYEEYYDTEKEYKELFVNSIDVLAIQTIIKHSEKQKTISAQISIEGSVAFLHALEKKIDGQLLIITPRENLATDIHSLLSLNNFTLLHGHTTKKQRNVIIQNWKNGNIKTLIGTRQASLIPAKNISAVIILNASSENYSLLSKNPRINSKRSAELLARQFNAPYIELSHLPSLSSIKKDFKLLLQKEITPIIIDLNKPEEKTGNFFLSETLLKSIKTTLHKDKSVLLSFNRKGIANRLQCSDCGHIPFCDTCKNIPTIRQDDLICTTCNVEMWIPKQCPECSSKKFGQKGIGNKKLKYLLKKIFPNNSVGIIDKETLEKADIQIVTEYYFQSIIKPFEKNNFGLVANLNTDADMLTNNYDGVFNTAQKLFRLANLAQQNKAEYIVQTWLPTVIKEMTNPEVFLKKEMETRKKYNLPPFTNFVTTRTGLDTQNKIIKNKKELTNFLKNIPDNYTVTVKTNSYDS